MAGPQDDWRVPRRARLCAISGRELAPGDRVVSELFDRGDSFERRDRLDDVAPPPNEVAPFSRWSFVVPPEPERRPGVDLDLALRFLRDLLAENDPERHPLAQVLSLLLVRKRRLKVVDRGTSDTGVRVVRVAVAALEEDEILEVPDPRLTPEVVAAVTREVNALFGFEEPPGVPPAGEHEPPAADDEPPAPPPPPGSEPPG